MKELTTYITEKLDINKINLEPGIDDFPFDGTYEEHIAFLTRMGYREVPWHDVRFFREFKNEFNNEHDKCFIANGKHGLYYNYIFFADTSKTPVKPPKNKMYKIIFGPYSCKYEYFDDDDFHPFSLSDWKKECEIIF